MNVPCKGTATHMVEIIYMHVHSNLQVVLKYAFFSQGRTEGHLQTASYIGHYRPLVSVQN